MPTKSTYNIRTFVGKHFLKKLTQGGRTCSRNMSSKY